MTWETSIWRCFAMKQMGNPHDNLPFEDTIHGYLGDIQGESMFLKVSTTGSQRCCQTAMEHFSHVDIIHLLKIVQLKCSEYVRTYANTCLFCLKTCIYI